MGRGPEKAFIKQIMIDDEKRPLLRRKRNPEIDEKCVPSVGVRHVQVLFMFLMLTVGVGTRVQFSVAIVAMTDNTTTSNPEVPVYEWPNKNIILSSFFWGYAVLQILAAMLGRVYGPKYFILASMGINTTICTVIPIVAREFGSYGVMVCRAMMGLAQGFFYPSVYNVLAKWVPASERTRMGAFALSGASFGTILTMPIVGFISSSWFGWPWSFYLYGILGFVWMIGYYIVGASSPASHRTISEKEKAYIECDLDLDGAKARVPWRAIFSSAPFWAIFFSTIGQTWGYQTLLAEIPNYMNKVMKFKMKSIWVDADIDTRTSTEPSRCFDIISTELSWKEPPELNHILASNGVLSAAPFLTCFLLFFVFGCSADFFINHKILSVKAARRMYTAIASFIPASALIVLSFLPDDAITLSVIMLVLAVGVQSASSAGFEINHIDLSPNFAGVILGVCNSCAEIVSICGPTAVHLIVIDEESKQQWRVIFLAAAVSYMVTCSLFITLMSTDVQPWDSVEQNKKECDEMKNNQIKKVKKTTINQYI